MANPRLSDLRSLLQDRYSDLPDNMDTEVDAKVLQSMAARGSCRAFLDQPVPIGLLETLSAIALASPSKSDLQQRDVIFVSSQDARYKLVRLVTGQPWIADAPMIAVFCGNNRRQRLLHEWRDVPFANDHLDAFFNATVDAAIALSAFVTAAEAAGLGCCPISAVRNDAAAVSALLDLPDHVFPVAGLAIGYPVFAPQISKRMPLKQTVHWDRFSETALQKDIADYDQHRAASQPYQQQRYPGHFGISATYGWSEDKTRQYSRPERENFGVFVRKKGFNLD
ncbi:MAG: nitroreductase family protein [Sulfitobacter sp.]